MAEDTSTVQEIVWYKYIFKYNTIALPVKHCEIEIHAKKSTIYGKILAVCNHGVKCKAKTNQKNMIPWRRPILYICGCSHHTFSPFDQTSERVDSWKRLKPGLIKFCRIFQWARRMMPSISGGNCTLIGADVKLKIVWCILKWTVGNCWEL